MDEDGSIEERLARDPADWNLRILAIELAARSGNLERARQLVREDPTTEPVSPSIQVRLHGALTRAKEQRGNRSAIEPVPPRMETDTRGESVGGGAFREVEFSAPESFCRESGRAPVPKLDRGLIGSRPNRYEGRMRLVPNDTGPPQRRAPSTRDRFSAMMFALITHLGLFVVVGLVALNTPRPKPPQLIVSIRPEPGPDLVPPPFAKPKPDPKPAVAAAQAIDVVSSVSASTFSVPDVDDSNDRLVPSLLPGLAVAGAGLEFKADAIEASNVNFFGISGSGKRIVFIVDATPDMLVDEKGGMDAYDKVKNEVGVMLAHLNRATHFNLLLYQGKRLVAFREEPVPGLPSNLRLAIEWLDPLNRDYEELGIRGTYGGEISVSDGEEIPLQAVDVAHYTKAIQKAMEWQASTVFCIAGGYERMPRSPTPEQLEEMRRNPPTPGSPGTIDPAEAERWQKAVAETRAWLERENAARRDKGISQKVVVNFNRLVVEQTGVSPPRRRGGTPATGSPVPLPPITPQDIEDHLEKLVKLRYKNEGLEDPSVHMVVFLGEDERIGEEEDHFRRLTRQNRGKLKILRGLSALTDVTE